MIEPRGPGPQVKGASAWARLRSRAGSKARRREPLSPDEIRSRLAEIPGWFHCVELGHGIRTKTASLCGEPVEHPLPIWQLVRPCLPVLRGRTVLDVGCNGGFYSFEAKRMGAVRVLGIEVALHHVRQAEFARDALGLDVEIGAGSVYDLSPERHGTFDVTLALGLIYHCKHPVMALERLASVTDDVLVLESEVLPPGHWPSYRMGFARDAPANMHAIAWVENPADSVEAVQNWFVPSVQALRSMVLSAGFARATVVTQTVSRAIVVALKASPTSALLAELHLLDGPSNVGRNGRLVFEVRAINVGTRAWPSAPGEGQVNLGAHLRSIDGAEIVRDLGRATLGSNVPPGGEARATLEVQAPESPGVYLVELDLVSEQVAWFADLGTIPLRCRVEVADVAG
ncbi:MAG: DUF1698 domain-containing protein [Acidobacteriota bacterium]